MRYDLARSKKHERDFRASGRLSVRIVPTSEYKNFGGALFHRLGRLCPIRCRYTPITNTRARNIYGRRLPSSTPFRLLLPTFINKKSLRMGRLHRLSFLLILIGPALAQLSYPNCSAGWEWVSFSKFSSIGPTPVSDRGPTNTSRTTL